jgi:[protein-PII] uridylyltransferase
LSERLTVLEVAGRPAELLYDLTSAIPICLLISFHITTFGEKAVDMFYVTDLTGKQASAKRGRRSSASVTNADAAPAEQV